MQDCIAPEEHLRKARWLLDRTRENNGLAPVDLKHFWTDQEAAIKAPFSVDILQAPLGIMMSGECVFDELGIPEDYWRYEQDPTWRLDLHKAYNDRAESIVGRRLLSEQPPDPQRQWPAIKTLSDLFGAANVWAPASRSYWLQESAHDEDELEALLNRVDRRLDRLREFLLPDNWDDERSRLTQLGVPPPRLRYIRGPVTFATSIYGAERLIFLIYDNPDLAAHFRDTILRAIIAIADLLDEEAGDTPETAPRGFGFADDNCYLLTPAMYEFFGFPILKSIFEKYAPDPGDSRSQHSDSPMAHLLPILSELDLTWVNLGPTIPASLIRRHLPNAIIHGQLAPFTFSRNEELNIVLEFLRDFDMTRDTRGLVFGTAGSINNGSRLTGMRLVMSAIQHFGRYDT